MSNFSIKRITPQNLICISAINPNFQWRIRQVTNNFMQLEPEALAQKKKMQMEMILEESDVKRAQRNKLVLEAEIRELKSKKQQAEMELTLKEGKLKRTNEEIVAMQNELIKLKHKIISAGRV